MKTDQRSPDGLLVQTSPWGLWCPLVSSRVLSRKPTPINHPVTVQVSIFNVVEILRYVAKICWIKC